MELYLVHKKWVSEEPNPQNASEILKD